MDGRDGELRLERWLATAAFAPAADGRLKPGAVVDEWRVETYLGAGLSAEVYRVTNVRLGLEGALKLLTDGSRGLRERFLAEADAIRFLQLRELPRFLGAGNFGEAPYYVMEYLQPLPDPMPRADVPRFMNGVAKAVQKLHDAGYVHRDLKPGNILCRRDGTPGLIDLGLIKRRGLGVSDPIVRHGRGLSIIDGKPVGVGTLDYAAPEQLLKGEFSVQSDVFSLGKILRALYEGHPPRNLRPVVRRATREQPADRYRSANEFAAAIRHRNRSLWILAFLGLMLASASAAYPMARPKLVAWVARFVRMQDRAKVSLVQGKDEADRDYFARIRSLAGRGNVEAQVCVAEAFFHGRGVATNRAEAVRWYRLAAEAGEPAAQASLGLCCLRGWGCEKDVAAAVAWYGRAADQGNVTALGDLAFCYMNGIGVAKDERLGFEKAMAAAQRGHAPAQALVGECYLDGRGVERSVERGETWLYRAARLGNKRARMLLETR